ncbi:MAG: translation initiation factor IF-2 [Firmicutes bacterium]|nr:translation initiation factor IF-2 [Bacillota bacterium]
MAKVRVYELAKELNISSKAMVSFLIDLGADVKNHMSTIDEDIALLVKDHFAEDEDEDEKLVPKVKPTPKESPPKPPPASKAKAKKSTSRRDKTPSPGKGKGDKKIIEIPETITVRELAELCQIPATELIKQLMAQGIMAGINQNVDQQAARMVAEKLGFTVKAYEPATMGIDVEEADEGLLEERAPVVTIMGHVDHGKTTLLDAIRETKVAASEAGGITQHIGAYQVEVKGKKITFLDTPGHEAFTAMRSRGAQVTDLAVLVVAADDGVMPQTVEAINHARAANVPILVAINKIDRPQANIDRVKQQLAERGLIPEEWGGDTICVPISALRKEGLDDLLEMILLVAEMQDLKANPHRLAKGTIVEAQLDRGRGPVATVLVQQGVLRIGDPIVAGPVHGRVRAMFDAKGERVDEAGPSTPVEVLGFNDVPTAGEILLAVEDEREARTIAEQYAETTRQEGWTRASRLTLDDLNLRIKAGEVKQLNLVVKGDVQGSVEALRQSLEKLSTPEVRINVIHGAVGGVSKSDVNLAYASEAIIIGFNVRPDPTARKLAESLGIEILLYRVIYEAIDDIKAAMEGMLEPEYQEVVLGQAEVRALFKVPNVGVVAGCYVTEGKILRSAQIRVIRDNVVIYEGNISSLKRFKDDVREVASGYECGIGVEKFQDLKEGDILEAFRIEEVKRS